MELADKGLNTQAQAIEDAQTGIRIAVRDGWLNRRHKAEINAKVQRIIRAAMKRIQIPDLRSAAFRSLNAFAERQYNTYLRRFGADTSVISAMLILANAGYSTASKRQAESVIKNAELAFETTAKGVPLQEYAKTYLETRVEPVITELCKQNALDPDDIDSRNSMRNRAEMEVRYNGHLEKINDLRAAGVKLVTCSVHADCSNRCYPWQGRVYSLDGTSGVTEDGKRFIPLETATDVYYTTKAGKTYKNGLLGFNCRHSLMPYKAGMVIPHVSRETQQREKDINTRQREMERTVRAWETQAVMNKGINAEKYSEAKREAVKARKTYIKFSHDNGRAYYPSRIKLL